MKSMGLGVKSPQQECSILLFPKNKLAKLYLVSIIIPFEVEDGYSVYSSEADNIDWKCHGNFETMTEAMQTIDTIHNIIREHNHISELLIWHGNLALNNKGKILESI